MNKLTIAIICSGIISFIIGVYLLFFMPAATVSKVSIDTFDKPTLYSAVGGVLTGLGVILAIYGIIRVFRDSTKSPAYM
jgi:membrane-bound ClpP family serine protease